MTNKQFDPTKSVTCPSLYVIAGLYTRSAA